MIPGEIILSKEDITINENKAAKSVKVTNTGKRPVQIGSHIHFFEVNRCLMFNRESTYGKRLNIPSGTAVRIEAGESKTVELIDFGGRKKIIGANELTQGYLAENKASALNKVKAFLEGK